MLFPKACSISWMQNKNTHCHKGVLKALRTFWRGFFSADTMERWCKVSEHPFLILQFRKVFWEWDRKGLIARFFVAFSAVLSIIAHRFIFYGRDLVLSRLSSEKTVQLPSFLYTLIIFNLHYTYQLLGIRYYKCNSTSLMTLHPKTSSLRKNLCATSATRRANGFCLQHEGQSPTAPTEVQSRPCFIWLSFVLLSYPQPSLSRDSQCTSTEKKHLINIRKRVNWIIASSKKITQFENSAPN